MTKLVIPEALNRNNVNVAKVGLENTGEASLEYARQCLGLDDYKDTHILDIGCGVRFSATFINRDIPLKAYTGIELHEGIVDFLTEKATAIDEKYQYKFWDVHNARYRKQGKPMSEYESFPVSGTFDVIWAWSVFTHLSPSDSSDMLRLARQHAKKDTQLFFSAFIDNEVDEFEDRDPVNTLTFAYFSEKYLTSLIEKAGWKVNAFYPPNPAGWVQCVFVCTPV